MRDSDYKSTYVDAVNRLLENHPRAEAMKLAVGGEFQAIGAIMRAIVIQAGLQPDHYVIDIGCGSGRLALALRAYLTGPYLGIDVVPELLAFARDACARPDWRFQEAAGIAIPEKDGAADMVCFFSVLTHLMHEDGFRYLQEAKRVLKPGGTIVFSFLDFTIDSHWDVFSGMLNSRTAGETTHHNQFMGREAVIVWGARLEMDVVSILDGNGVQVTLDDDMTLDDGRVLPREASVGQSVCVLRKRVMTNGETASSRRAEPHGPAPAEYTLMNDALSRSSVRVAQLESRLAETERRLKLVDDYVQTILRTRSWRAFHALISTLRAPFVNR